MAKCSVCGKGVVFGQNVSHSNRKTNRSWKPNIRKVKAIVDGTPTTVAVCSRCLHACYHSGNRKNISVLLKCIPRCY